MSRLRYLGYALALSTALACGGAFNDNKSDVVAVAVIGDASLNSATSVNVKVNNGNNENWATATMIRKSLRAGESWDTRSLPDNPAGRLTFIVHDAPESDLRRQVSVPLDVPRGARLTIRVSETASRTLRVYITGS